MKQKYLQYFLYIYLSTFLQLPIYSEQNNKQ